MSERTCVKCGGWTNLRSTPYPDVFACDLHCTGVLLDILEAIEAVCASYVASDPVDYKKVLEDELSDVAEEKKITPLDHMRGDGRRLLQQRPEVVVALLLELAAISGLRDRCPLAQQVIQDLTKEASREPN